MSKEYLLSYLSAVSEINMSTGFSFGRTIIAQVLTASKSKNVLRFNSLECFGRGSTKSQAWWITFGKNIAKVQNILKEKVSETSSNKVIITFEVGSLGHQILLNAINPPEIELPEEKKTLRTNSDNTSQDQTYSMFLSQLLWDQPHTYPLIQIIVMVYGI